MRAAHDLTPLSAQPVVIIGAPRSGTNMLRDCLTALPNFSTWPCDEVPYIWRHGNLDVEHDELDPSHARPRVRDAIRRHIERQARRGGTPFLVEKTCANSLRVEFVDRILPEARYLFIFRDGIDASASATRRWSSSIDLGYTLAKARFVPLPDVPRHGIRWLMNRVRQKQRDDSRLAIWGPAYRGMRDDARRLRLEELAATQWARCVERAADAFMRMPSELYRTLRYEDFVQDPRGQLKATLHWIRADATEEELDVAVARVHRSSVGKAQNTMGTSIMPAVEEIVRPVAAKAERVHQGL